MSTLDEREQDIPRIMKSWEKWTDRKITKGDVEEVKEKLLLVYNHYYEVDAYILEAWYDRTTVPDHLQLYIDEDKIIRDLLFDDYYNDEENKVLWYRH